MGEVEGTELESVEVVDADISKRIRRQRLSRRGKKGESSKADEGEILELD